MDRGNLRDAAQGPDRTAAGKSNVTVTQWNPESFRREGRQNAGQVTETGRRFVQLQELRSSSQLLTTEHHDSDIPKL
jgi:hypothetical protein